MPFWLDFTMAKTTIAGMLGAFLLQQFFILAKTGVTVAWHGSEVSFFEEIAEPEAEPEEDGAEEGIGGESVAAGPVDDGGAEPGA